MTNELSCPNGLPPVSIVIIGRDEAHNLPDCIQSIRRIDYPQQALEVLYVDTDSNDGSPEVARRLGVKVYEEHSDFPSPGRARNRGLQEAQHDIIHFVDGDMWVNPYYLGQAVTYLGKDNVACVIGRLEERFSATNLVSRILEYPWKNRAAGYVHAPGGGGTFLKKALIEVGGYNPDILKGQETELGERLRRHGYCILLIDQTMGNHDYGLHDLGTVWTWYQTKGRSFGKLLKLEPTGFIAAHQRLARRALWQAIVAILLVIAATIAGRWWLIPVLPFLLVLYVIVRYWQPARLRSLRIGYFLMEYFFKPAIWLGMMQQLLDRN